MDLHRSFCDLLQEIGPGQRITRSPYDTAWVARLADLGEPLGYEALDWLRENQLADGSWGSLEPRYYHDRLVCTLAAMIVLAKTGDPADQKRLNRAQMALETTIRGLGADPVETIGFEMIAPTLSAEADAVGAIAKRDATLERLTRYREAKLAALPTGMVNRYVTVAFSAEMIGADRLYLLDLENLQEANGSVAYSPAATAFFAIYVEPGHSRAIEFLRLIANEGAVPYTAPIDVFELGWTLWNLDLAGCLDGELKGLCQRHLDFLEEQWIPGKGIPAVSNLTLTDGDTTAVIHHVLTSYGRRVDLEGVLHYEEGNHFRCFGLEANPSISTNIHVLTALRRVGRGREDARVQKILSFLEATQTLRMFWFDKWHASPYYTTAHAVIACAGLRNDLLQDAVYWMLTTQNRNGSWGYYMPTAEETAYCLQALIAWKRQGGDVPVAAVKMATSWLRGHTDPPYPPLWVGKSLYCPVWVVRSAVLSALMMAQEV
jgi:halimadienyl-diphosphate synthase